MRWMAKGTLVGIVGLGLVGCSTPPDESSADSNLTSAVPDNFNPHTPAVGSAERTAFMDGVRQEFDLRIQSTALAEGRKDVEFVVEPGPDAFRIGGRDGQMWGYLAATVQDPVTHKPFDYSHAPKEVQLAVQDEDGNPNHHIIAIMQKRNGVWVVAVTGTFPNVVQQFFFAPNDVSWQDLPCTANAPFGVLEGAVASAAGCGASPPASSTSCRPGTPPSEQALTNVPSNKVAEVTLGFQQDGADSVTSTRDGNGTFTVTATFRGCP
jgi:hypothetical protein